MAASTSRFTENQMGCNFALYFTSNLSNEFLNFLPYSKTIKHTRTLSLFAANNSGRLYK